MYQWQKDAALRWVQDQLRQAKLSNRQVSVALLAQEAIKKQGITFGPDVKRLSKQLCSDLAEIRAQKQRNEKDYANGVKAISERIAS